MRWRVVGVTDTVDELVGMDIVSGIDPVETTRRKAAIGTCLTGKKAGEAVVRASCARDVAKASGKRGGGGRVGAPEAVK